jgi:hypothetical protein
VARRHTASTEPAGRGVPLAILYEQHAGLGVLKHADPIESGFPGAITPGRVRTTRQTSRAGKATDVPAFAYQAVDAGGKRLHGETEAPDATALTRTLESGLRVVDVEKAKPAGEGLSIGLLTSHAHVGMAYRADTPRDSQRPLGLP